MPRQKKQAPAKVKLTPPVVVGIDQSYSKIGFAAVTRHAILTAEVVDLSKLDPTQTRLAVRELVRTYLDKWKPRLIVCERVRLFAGRYISMQTAKQLSALTACIVDAAYTHHSAGRYNEAGEWERKPIKVYSADTRSWKKGILGEGNADKKAALDWLIEHLPEDEGFSVVLDHNAADAACMGRYAFLPEAKLTRER